jgi:hypothetical protein
MACRHAEPERVKRNGMLVVKHPSEVVNFRWARQRRAGIPARGKRSAAAGPSAHKSAPCMGAARTPTLMSQSLVKNLVHLIFSTKHRERLLTDAVAPNLHPYMAGILKDLDSPALIINSVADPLLSGCFAIRELLLSDDQ